MIMKMCIFSWSLNWRRTQGKMLYVEKEDEDKRVWVLLLCEKTKDVILNLRLKCSLNPNTGRRSRFPPMWYTKVSYPSSPFASYVRSQNRDQWLCYILQIIWNSNIFFKTFKINADEMFHSLPINAAIVSVTSIYRLLNWQTSLSLCVLLPVGKLP